MDRLKKYKLLLKQGRVEESKQVLTRLLKQHEAFATSYTAGYHLQYLDIDFKELFHCAQIGMCLAAKKYNEKEGVGFLTYARYWMRDEIQKCIRSHRARLHHHKSVRLTKAQMQELRANPFISAEELGVDSETFLACLTFLQPWRFESNSYYRNDKAISSDFDTVEHAQALETARKAKEFFTADELRFLQQFEPVKGTEIEKKVARFFEWLEEEK